MNAKLRPQDALYRGLVEPTSRREPSQAFEDRPSPEGAPVPARARSVRDLIVMQGDLTEFGYTEVGCARFDFMNAHGRARG